MTGDPSGSADDRPTWAKVSRRHLLAAAGTGVATTLAGCDHLDTSGNTPPANTPDVTLKDVRVVQTVEDSEHTRSGDTMSHPPIVAGEYATVMFDVDITHDESLPDIVPVTVTSPGTNFDYVQQVSKQDLQYITRSGEAAATFDRTEDFDFDGQAPPVLKMPADIEEITVEILHQHIDGGEVTLTEGVNCDFRVREMDTLRVGFINVKDPGDAQSPEFTFQEAQRLGKLFTTDIDWGDQNGETIYYDRTVNSAVEFLKRAYPGKVVAYRHKETDPMLGVIRENWGNGTGKDASRAKKALNSIRSSNSFPQNGTIYADEGLTNQDAIDLMDGSDGAFDIWVMILPRGTTSGTQHYFAAHGMTNTLGYHWNFSTAVASLETKSDTTSDASNAMITAQEIGHRYSNALYPGQLAAGPSDQRHVDDEVESVGYDFTGGTYNLVNDFEIRNGSFSMESLGSAPTARTHPSYMNDPVQSWTDNRIHRYLIDGNYTPRYDGGLSGGQDCFQSPVRRRFREDPTDVIEIHGNTDGDVVDIDSTDANMSIPDELREQLDRERDPDAMPVEVTLEGPEGESLATTVVPDLTTGTHGEHVHESFDVSLPFPKMGVALSADRAGDSTTINPIVHPLQSALRRLPERGFVSQPAEARELLRGQLAEVDARMSEGDYAGAHDAMAAFERSLGDTVRESYESYAYQPDLAGLRRRAEGMLGRLGTLADADTGDLGGGFTLTLPDGRTRSVRPVERDQPVEEYYGYDTGPSDSSNTPDDLETNDASVTFLYRNSSTGELSLVVLNGDAAASSDGGGKAVFTFEGVGGATWRVRDGPHGSGFGDFDTYTTAEGAIEGAESVIWGWDDSNTDGGAIGPLGEAPAVEITHRAAGTVRDDSGERAGIDVWLFVDGADVANPIELVRFEGDEGDVAVRVASDG